MKQQINTIREALAVLEAIGENDMYTEEWQKTKQAITALSELEAMAGEQGPEVCGKCHGTGYYDEGHECDDGTMAGGNYVVCDKCAAPVAQQQQYDQTALELCAVCGWKTLIPGDCCLNCERNKAQQPQALTRDRVRDIFMAHGFTIKDGQTDLKEYVYEAAAALLAAAQQPQARATWLTDPKQTKERQFAEFLNDRRNMNVSAVFHDLMGKFAALLAPRQAEAVPSDVTDAMALAFHRALTDGSISQSEVEDIKTGLRAALAHQQAEAVPTVQIVNCKTCKHSGKSCDDYPCRNCGVEFGDGPFNRWEAPQQAEAVHELTSTEVNDACWAFVETMPHQLPGPIFNDLKPAIHAAICKYVAAAPQQAEVVPSDAMIVAGARALCNRFADTGGVSREDQWNIYAEDFKDDARAVLSAAIAAQGAKT